MDEEEELQRLANEANELTRRNTEAPIAPPVAAVVPEETAFRERLAQAFAEVAANPPIPVRQPLPPAPRPTRPNWTDFGRPFTVAPARRDPPPRPGEVPAYYAQHWNPIEEIRLQMDEEIIGQLDAPPDPIYEARTRLRAAVQAQLNRPPPAHPLNPPAYFQPDETTGLDGYYNPTYNRVVDTAINAAIAQNLPNEEIGLGRMNYDQLRQRFPALTDRYLPDLSSKNNALSALRTIESDRYATTEEKAALKEYVGTHDLASEYNYQWCEECESLVGFPAHTHCPHCIYPCTVPTEPLTGPASATQVAPCGFCGVCCQLKGHRYCDTCHVHSDRLCRHCLKCAGCCACRLCPLSVSGCQEMQECEDCGKCFDHCTCPALKTNGIHGKTFPAFKRKERKLFDCGRMAGVEWEFNRLSTNRYFDNWLKKWLGERHEDASCGYEAVTAPIAGDYMVKCVTALGTVFKKSKATIDNRCSIHVHADAKDLQWADMFRLLKVYSIVEPILYMLAGQERLDNRYCVPCGKDYASALNRIDRKDAIMAVAFTTITRDGHKADVNLLPDNGRVSQRAVPGKRADVHLNSRRKGLNILPWLAGRGPRPKTPVAVIVQARDTIETVAHRHNVSVAALMRWNKLKPSQKLREGGKLIVNKRTVAPDTTVEFRIHPNTHDETRVINWVKVILRLVDWAAKSTDKDLENLPKSALRILCQVIAPECSPWIMSRVKEWRNETSRNLGRQQRRISLKGGKYSY